jgi:isoleucyl-tRNA synthetase
MFARLSDAYRRIRNTLRILHGNLFDFDVEGRAPSRLESDGSDNATTTLIDRWILNRLDEVIDDCRRAYESFEFHKVYHTINQFCAVDLSSLYVDITKDRMYCDAPASPRRCATQFAMHEIFGGLCRLLAPVLAFTSEEAWQHGNGGGSVHLQLFPEASAAHRDSSINQRIDQLLNLRGLIGQALERARQEKLIGNSLEARVTLKCERKLVDGILREELEEFFILSDLVIEEASEPSAIVEKTSFAKCARCWRHKPTVGRSAAHPDLCDRCESVVAARPSST